MTKNTKYGGYAVFSIMLYNDKYIAMNVSIV